MRYPYGVIQKTETGLTYNGNYSQLKIAEWVWRNNIQGNMLIVNAYTSGEQFDPDYFLKIIGNTIDTKSKGILVYGDLEYITRVKSLQECYEKLHNLNYRGEFIFLKVDANWGNNPKLKEMAPIITVKHVKDPKER